MIKILDKNCTKCGIKLTSENYFKSFKKNSWYICIPCFKKWYKINRKRILQNQKRYYNKNKDKKLQYAKKYREENKDRINQYRILYENKNKEKIKGHNKEYRQNNRDIIRQRERNYEEKNKDKIKVSKKKYREENRDKIRKRAREFARKHKEERKEYYKKNKKRIKSYRYEINRKENEYRKKLGLPKIGEGFKKEMELLFYIKCLFNKEQIIVHDRTVLNGLELDIYLPSLKLAFEYQGIQHYQYREFIHKTIERFKIQQFRDQRKKELCKEKGIILIEVKYDEKLSEQLILKKLKSHNIKSIQGVKDFNEY